MGLERNNSMDHRAWKREKISRYSKGLDRDAFREEGIQVIQHQPWQFGLLHPDLSGKFVWYPTKGTLMYEDEPHRGSRVGHFPTTKLVIEQIKRTIDIQH